MVAGYKFPVFDGTPGLIPEKVEEVDTEEEIAQDKPATSTAEAQREQLAA